MNTSRLTLILAVLVLASVSFGKYRIVLSTTAGGGGTSTGGHYVLTGTIGQHLASYSASKRYDLFSGFWPAEPSCFVDFEDFAKFAEYWLMSGPDLPADLDGSKTVDLADLQIFAYAWLSYCPCNWPLK